ncbi:unnamed protein product [Phaedon cochleariae]|uniref:Gamma-glutamyltranspeptidase 1 n=1 Tax=Phaedon cochleariae TaxID=80249 RepID=A0A9N9S805_PHACE|nr:unnamed protein product [Phaedon cochleariae]
MKRINKNKKRNEDSPTLSILRKGGNAVDAAIAALFCEGVAMPECMGLGGGFLLTMYNKTTGEVWSLNAREAAPRLATEDMFVGQPANASWRGGRAAAVPGELRGYWHLYKRFGGGVPWRELVQPTIDLCNNGIYVTKILAHRFMIRKQLLYKDLTLRYATKELVIRKSIKLNGKNIYIAQDLSREDRDDQKILLKHRNDARAKKLNAEIEGTTSNINGDSHTVDQLKDFGKEEVEEEKRVVLPESRNLKSTSAPETSNDLYLQDEARALELMN